MTILVAPCVPTHPDFVGVTPSLQTKTGFDPGEPTPEGLRFVTDPPGRTGRESPWRRNADGRRFLYLAWRDPAGAIVRRMKLYEESVAPLLETGRETVAVLGLKADGSPEAPTARVLPRADAP